MATTSRTALASVDPIDPPVGGWELMYGGSAHEPVNGSRLPVESAIDGSVVATIPNADRDDLDRAVAVAIPAARDWARRSPRERAGLLQAFGDAVGAASHRIGWLDTINAGMPIAATTMETEWVATDIVSAGRLAAEIKGTTYPATDGVWGYTTREPYGVVADISPFNHPAASAASAIGTALAAGNAIVVKPSEFTSLSALEIGRIAQDLLPPGLVSVMTGEGARIGGAICEHPDIPRISFTGSVPTGRTVLRTAAEHIKHVTVELGGKGPLAILPDVDLDAAVAVAVGGMNLRGVQAGQSCQSTSRVLVHESAYDEFAARMVESVAQVRIGDPRHPDTEMGALAFRAHLKRVRDYIAIGQQDGATLLAGGGTPRGLESGLFIEPTVFGDVEPSMRIAQEEIFGPVVALMRWSTEEELIDIANGVEFGLTARIACGDIGPGMRLAQEIDAGRMWINLANGGPAGMPFGGFKHSGVGKVGDFQALMSMTREKAITVAL